MTPMQVESIIAQVDGLGEATEEFIQEVKNNPINLDAVDDIAEGLDELLDKISALLDTLMEAQSVQ